MKRKTSATDPTALYVGDLPGHWSEENVRDFHRSVGLADALSSVKILPRKLRGETGCAILRYTDDASTALALQTLNGTPVETESGQQKHIRARYADPASAQGQLPTKVASRGVQPYAQQYHQPWGAGMNHGGGGAYTWGDFGSQADWGSPRSQPSPKQSAPQNSPSNTLYVTEVPAHFTEQSLQVFHDSLGLTGFTGARILPQKHAQGETCAVMMRYATLMAAQEALTRLNGHPMTLSSGSVKYMEARFADQKKGGKGNDATHQGKFAEQPKSGKGSDATYQVQPSIEMPVPSAAPMRTPVQDVPPPGCDPTAIYLSDVPVGLDSNALVRLHKDYALVVPENIKLLASKIDGGETCCAILHYYDADCASNALQALHGMSATTSNGRQKRVTARYATAKKGGGGGAENEYSTDYYSPPVQPRHTMAAGGKKGAGWWSPAAVAQTPTSEQDPDMMPSVYVSDLPGDISEDGLRQLLYEVGVDASLMVSSKFLPRKIQAHSVCALLRYPSESYCNETIAALNGHTVVLPDGRTRRLIAKMADPPKRLSGGHQEVYNQGGGAYHSNGGGNGTCDLYVSEVPVDWTEDTIAELHNDIGLGASVLANTKILPRRHQEYPTGAAILRYHDHYSASSALRLLEGRPVATSAGQRQLVVKFADPPKKNR